MARGVEADHLVVAGEGRGQRPPAPAGLAEPVDQDDPGAGTVAFAVQGHGEGFLRLP